MNPALALKPKLRSAMMPQLCQSLNILSMRGDDIRAFMRNRAEDNPFIEMRVPEPASVPRAGADTPPDFDYVSYDAVHPLSLSEYLLAEIGGNILDADMRAVAIALIEHVSPAGWLEPEGVRVAATLGVAGEDFEALLKQLHELDPPGIFARNLTECLGLQLARLGLMDAAAEAVLTHLACLPESGIDGLSVKAELPQEKVVEVLADLRRCNPKPASIFTYDEGDVFHPDLIIEQRNGDFTVGVNAASLPMVTISDAKVCDEGDVVLLKNAKEEIRLIDAAIKYRSEMLLAAGAVLVRQQQEFLREGEIAIKSFTMANLAEALACNKSTISRLVTDKLCQTPRGMIEMKAFFDTSIPQPDGRRIASRAVMAQIKQILSTETTPISDSALVERLAEKGFSVARRTIVGYRQSNKIPNYLQRRNMTDGEFPMRHSNLRHSTVRL